MASILKGARLGNTSLDLGCQFHHAFWMGDMNFRCRLAEDDGTPIPREEQIAFVNQLVANKDWDKLQQYDELLHCIR